MTIRRTRNPVGTELTPENIQGIGGTELTREGEISVDSSDSELKVHLDSATRTVVTEDQTQVLTNKTIDADLNTISDLEVDNLKSGVLNVSTTLSGASDTQLPSALAVKTYIDDKAAAQNEASEISVVPAGTIIATNVQAAIEELDGDIQGHINDTVDAHDASAISNSPSGNLAATDVQGALNELQSNIDTNYTAFTDHLSDAVDAHDASAISNAPSGNLAATDVQAALNELQTSIDDIDSDPLTFTNKSLVDASTFIVDSVDPTIKLNFNVEGTSATTTTLFTTQTANRAIILPDASTTLVGTDNVQTIQNKAFTDSLNAFVDSSDPTKEIKFDAVGTTGTKTTIRSSQTADVVITLPNVTGTVVTSGDTGTVTSTMILNDTIVNADINTAAAIARSKLASGSNNALVANNGSGVLSDVSGISVSAFGLSVSPSKNFSLELADDATTTGADASVTAFAGSALTFSNGSLTSIANIPAGSNGQELIIINRTNSPISIKDESGAIGTASARIFTGTGADLTFADNAALFLTYDALASRWQVIGGSGGGGGGTLVGLSDVSIGVPTDNQVLTYDSGSSLWINQDNSLQQVYNNSATSEIETNVTNGALDLKRGSASDSDDVLRILNNAGVVVAQTNALGQHNTMYSSPENMLKNGSLELPSIADWTCTVGTCTRTTTSGEFSHGTAALKVALSAQAMNVSQTVTTPSGIQKQGFARVIYRVPSTMADFQVCTLVDAAEQTCVPTANLVKDDTFRSIEIPLTFGTTSAGIKFKTTSAYSATAYFDGMVLGQGLGLQNLMLDNVFSATVSSGTITNQSKTWLTSCTSSTSAVCTFASGIFTSSPNCTVTTDNALTNVQGAQISSISSSSVTITQVAMASGTPINGKFYITCQKSGNDYLASSANVYSQASGNYDWTSYGSFTAGTGSGITNYLGTLTGNANGFPCKHRRNGGNLEMACDFTTGTVSGAGLVSIILPNSLTIDTTKILATNTTSNPGQKVGELAQAGNANATGWVVTATGTAVDRVYIANNSNGTSSLTPALGSSFYSTSSSSIKFSVPISGWSNSNVIVGSFENVPVVPGAGARIDTFSVSYGTTNATTICSASPCSYLDQIGTAVTSITRVGTGQYSMNTTKTYTKLKCSGNATQAGISGLALHGDGATPSLACLNCSAIVFTTGVISANRDSIGTLNCQGTF